MKKIGFAWVDGGAMKNRGQVMAASSHIRTATALLRSAQDALVGEDDADLIAVRDSVVEAITEINGLDTVLDEITNNKFAQGAE